MDSNTPMVTANMDAIWKGKITLSAGYKEDSKAIRKISYSDTQGMWGYKDKLTKIVIENKKNVKTALEGGQVYGPFDESEYETKAVESYVVCEADDTNCIGYLQSDGKVVANSDSSNLFSNFTKVSEIEGLENLNTKNVINMMRLFSDNSNLTKINLNGFDTSHVTNMMYMFSYCSNLTHLELDSFDTRNVTNMSNMFNGLSQVTELNLNNFVTTNVTDMSYMFNGMSSLQTLNVESFNTNYVENMFAMFYHCSNLRMLDVSNFNTTNVSNMNMMFSGTSSLQSITFGPNFVHKQGATTTSMFIGCGAPERPTDDSWSEVSF